MDYWWDILNLVLIFSIFAISLNLLVGYTGQVSVAHAAFGAIVGYTAAYLSAQTRAGILAGACGGGVRRGSCRRAHEPAGTAAEPRISRSVDDCGLVHRARHRRRCAGAWWRLRHDRQQSRESLRHCRAASCIFPHQWVLPLLAFTAFTFLVCYRMGESAWGRVLRAIRDDETAARALGCNVFAFKVVVFGITSALAGLAGVLLFYYNQIASTSVYGLDVSLKIFAMTIFGGLGNFAGSIFGAAVLQLLQPMLEKIVQHRSRPGVSHSAGRLRAGTCCAGARAATGSVAGGILSHLRALRPPRPDCDPRPEAKAVNTVLTREAPLEARHAHNRRPAGAISIILEVRDLSKRFGGIAACRDLNLDLQRGKIAALGRSQRRRQDHGIQSFHRRFAG